MQAKFYTQYDMHIDAIDALARDFRSSMIRDLLRQEHVFANYSVVIEINCTNINTANPQCIEYTYEATLQKINHAT